MQKHSLAVVPIAMEIHVVSFSGAMEAIYIKLEVSTDQSFNCAGIAL